MSEFDAPSFAGRVTTTVDSGIASTMDLWRTKVCFECEPKVQGREFWHTTSKLRMRVSKSADVIGAVERLKEAQGSR